MKKILILGCGYLGSHLANYFRDKQWNVSVIGRKSIYSERLNCEITFHEVNLNEISEVETFIERGQVVLYTAGSLNATNQFSDILTDMDEYYPSFIKLINVCASMQIERFIFLSSAGTVYGDIDTRAREEDCLNPVNIYGLQKVFLENLIRIKHAETNALPYLILRVSNPYGGFQSTQKKQGIISVLIDKAFKQEEFVLWTDKNATRDYIYIQDFLEATYESIHSPHISQAEIINIGSGIGTTIETVIDLVEKKTKKTIDIKYMEPKNKVIMNNVLDINKLNNLVSYYPSTTVYDGISMTVDNYMRK